MKIEVTQADIPKCDSYMTNFVLCGAVATHRERCHNGIDYDYYCDHHAQMRKRQGGAVEPLNIPAVVKRQTKGA